MYYFHIWLPCCSGSPWMVAPLDQTGVAGLYISWSVQVKIRIILMIRISSYLLWTLKSRLLAAFLWFSNSEIVTDRNLCHFYSLCVFHSQLTSCTTNRRNNNISGQVEDDTSGTVERWEISKASTVERGNILQLGPKYLYVYFNLIFFSIFIPVSQTKHFHKASTEDKHDVLHCAPGKYSVKTFILVQAKKKFGKDKTNFGCGRAIQNFKNFPGSSR